MEKKIIFILSGVLVSLVLLELGLRLAGSSKSNDAYKILCLGESMTQGQYPRYLESVLNNKNPGMQFIVIDKGRQVINTNYILANLENNLDKYKPDMVITMMGVNDGKSGMAVDVSRQKVSCYRNLKVYKLMGAIYLSLKRCPAYTGTSSGGMQGKSGDKINESLEDKPAGIKQGDQSYLELADSYGKTGRYEEAEKMCRKALAINPKDIMGYLHLAYWYIEQKKYKEAEELYRKAIEVNPENEWGYIKLGDLYIEQNKFKQAEELYLKATELNPKNEQGLMKLGNCCRQTGRSAQALELFKKMIELKPGNELGYLSLGDYFWEVGKFEEAKDLYKKAIKLNPKNDQGYMKLGDCSMEQKRFKEAKGFYQKAAEQNPKNDQIYIKLGDSYRQENRSKEAEELYKKALEINPENELAYRNLGDWYKTQGKLDEAENIYRKAIEYNPKQEKAYYRLFALYELQNNYEKAAGILKEGMKLENDKDMSSDGRVSDAYDKENKDIKINYNKIKEESRSLYFGPGTVYNYKRLRKILKERNITYVCVQYPMRELTDLKGIFDGDKGIVFIDNEKSFKDVVEKEGYDAYFRDQSGHYTSKGNKLLVKNIADAITREVFHK